MEIQPPGFDGDCLKFRSFREEATTFADCCGFGDIFEGNREVPIASSVLTYAQISSRGFTNDEIERHRKAYQFLRSALSSDEVSCCERIPTPRLGQTLSHGITLSPFQKHKLSMTVFSHTL